MTHTTAPRPLPRAAVPRRAEVERATLRYHEAVALTDRLRGVAASALALWPHRPIARPCALVDRGMRRESRRVRALGRALDRYHGRG